MANSRYVSGRRAEWKLRSQLEAEGFVCFRTAGSRSAFDLIAIDVKDSWNPVRLIQVKSTRDKGAAPRIIRKFFSNLPLPNPMSENYTQEIWVWIHGKGWVCECAN